MRRSSPHSSRNGVDDAAGFSFLEVLVSLAATIIVMGVVFGLLAQGSGASTEEFERTDLQAQARAALQMLSQDLLVAGGNLPPEFPAIRPPSSMGIQQDVPEGVELIGDFEDASGAGAVPVLSFDGRLAKLEADPARFRRGQLVLVYDDEPTHGKWMFGLVESVVGGPAPEMVLLTRAGEAITDASPPVALPHTIDSYNRPLPESGFITPITIIGYGVDREDVEERPSLWRQVNWGEPVDVAYIEDLEIRYFVGGTVLAPVSPSPRNRGSGQIFGQGLGGRNRRVFDEGGEREMTAPPEPQPIPALPIQERDLIRGVRIIVTSRSKMANLRGSAGQDPSVDEGFLRETLSTRVAPRNLLIQADRRRQESEAAEARVSTRTDPNVQGGRRRR